MWKLTLKQLEDQKQWDDAIDFMISIVAQEQSIDAYLAMEYLLMNLLVEEQYDEIKHDYYASLIWQYFDESYALFKESPEYLYYMGWIASMSEWYLNIDQSDAIKMITTAVAMNPNNSVYMWYDQLDKDIHSSDVIRYAQCIIYNTSHTKEILSQKGSLGEYILGMMTHWSKCILGIL